MSISVKMSISIKMPVSKFNRPLILIWCICKQCKQKFKPLCFGTLLQYQFLSFFKSLKDVSLFFEKTDDKFSKYWVKKSDNEIIDEADRLYDENKYMEVYELLNRIKFNRNVEIHWRIGRALYKLSYERNIKSDIQNEMVSEAFELLRRAIEIDWQNSNAHKWYALLFDRLNMIQGLEFRLRNSEIVKKHMAISCELNPEDIESQYMLGRWCYEMTHLSLFQRFIARLFYADPPYSTYEEAYKYLVKAEELMPGKILANTYLLGKTCIQLGEFYRAQYYLNLVANLPPRNDYETQCVKQALKEAKKLKKYELGKEALFFGYPFEFGE